MKTTSVTVFESEKLKKFYLIINSETIEEITKEQYFNYKYLLIELQEKILLNINTQKP